MEGTLEELRRISNCPEGATFSQLGLRKSVVSYLQLRARMVREFSSECSRRAETPEGDAGPVLDGMKDDNNPSQDVRVTFAKNDNKSGFVVARIEHSISTCEVSSSAVPGANAS